VAVRYLDIHEDGLDEIRRPGEASEPFARRADVSIVGWVSAKRVTQRPWCPEVLGYAFG
jgi:hypothetical protein